MEFQEYLELKKDLRNGVIEYIDSQTDIDDEFSNLSLLIKNQNIIQNRDSFKSLLYLLNKISNDHHRLPDLYTKIDKILFQYQNEIKQTFSNSEIFNIFQSNKRNLLFLFNQKIIEIDDSIVKSIVSKKEANYASYFYPELRGKVVASNFKMNEIEKYDADMFNKKREDGENDEYICELIRNDSIVEFVKYVNQTNYPLNAFVNRSIFETNSFLLRFDPRLIEYAAFFGSTQIFNYLRLNNVEFKSTIFLYAVHSNNNQMIYLLEKEKAQSSYDTQIMYLYEAIKCHHNEIANYLENDLLEVKMTSILGLCAYHIDYMNYEFFPDEIDNEYVFYFLCKYDQTDFVSFVLNNPSYMKGINLSNRIILIKNLNYIP